MRAPRLVILTLVATAPPFAQDPVPPRVPEPTALTFPAEARIGFIDAAP